MTREEAINCLYNLGFTIGEMRHQHLWVFSQAITEIIQMIGEMPDILVKHGHWELDGTCSVCGKHTLQSYGNFCCYCGADMNGNTSNRGETECPAYLPRTISNTIDVNTIITDDTTNNLVAVVRCKDCRYRTPQPDDERDCCDLTYSAISNNDFCSYGERKEAE